MNVLHYLEHHSKKLSREHFVHLVKIALVDGKVDNSEHEMLFQFGKKLSFTDQEIEAIIQTPGKTTFHPTYELNDRFDQLFDIVKLLLVNGKASNDSINMASCYAVALGFQVADADSIIQFLIDGIKESKDEKELFYEYKLKLRSY